jgi:hypothetical protein
LVCGDFVEWRQQCVGCEGGCVWPAFGLLPC